MKLMLCFPSPGIWTKKLTKDLNSDLEVKVQVQFQSCNLDYNNNNIFIHTCYNCIEQYIPINNNILRIIKHVMLNI